MKSDRLIAALITAVIAALTVLLMVCVTVRAGRPDREWPPRHETDIALAPQEEQYFDVVSEPAPAAKADPAPAYAPEPMENRSEAAPQTGHEMRDRGPKGDAPALTASKKDSPVKTKPEKPRKPQGPDREQQEREAARRRATAATADAFKKSQGKNNTDSRGSKPGNSGTPEGGNSAVNGAGTGTAGGGWVIPRYASVPSTKTGSIKMTLRIDRQGKVTSVSFTGGTPPAATDAALRRAVEREVRSRRFTRSDGSEAPESATAYITYTFH